VCADGKAKPGQKAARKEAAAGAQKGGAKAGERRPLKAEDSANEHDGCSEVSASSVNMEPKQDAAGADAVAAAAASAERSRAEKGKGKMEERRRNDSASSLRCRTYILCYISEFSVLPVAALLTSQHFCCYFL
jgi:hypothetical protein